jgi:DNA-binding NarL/FixJ family response regulator
LAVSGEPNRRIGAAGTDGRRKEHRLGPIKVLIAEDAPQVRRALASLIESEPGIEVVGEAEDAVEAIELARAHRPEVAVIDVKMPGGGGSRAAREILELSPRTRVIALSAHAERDWVAGMMEAGAISYLLKGGPAEQILSTIVACAERDPAGR